MVQPHVEAIWDGTWLCAVFGSRSEIGPVYGDLILTWKERALLGAGRAILLGASPYGLTLEDLDNPEYRPELVWHSLSEATMEQLADHYISSMILRVAGSSSAIPEVRVDFDLLRSGGFSATVSAPFAKLVEECDRDAARRNLESFIDLCSLFFVSRIFFAGAVGEEVRVENFSDSQLLADRIADWAFLGASLSRQLDGALRVAESQGVSVTRLDDGGVFMRWGDWWSSRKPGADWMVSLKSALEMQLP